MTSCVQVNRNARAGKYAVAVGQELKVNCVRLSCSTVKLFRC
jgi:hypothetical protein